MRMDGQTDLTKLLVAFRNSVNTSKTTRQDNTCNAVCKGESNAKTNLNQIGRDAIIYIHFGIWIGCKLLRERYETFGLQKMKGIS
jgi:hypothetical protein